MLLISDGDANVKMGSLRGLGGLFGGAFLQSLLRLCCGLPPALVHVVTFVFLGHLGLAHRKLFYLDLLGVQGGLS